MDKLKTFLKSSTFKRFLWHTLAGFLGLIVIFLGDLNWVYAPVVISIISGVTKEINNYYK